MSEIIIIGPGKVVSEEAIRQLKEAYELRNSIPEPIDPEKFFGHGPTLELPRYEPPRLGRGSHRKWPVPK